MNVARSPRFSRRFRRFAILGALVVLGFAFRSHYTLAVVSGTSMLPALKPGDVLLVDKRAYEQIEPHRGDVIVAKYLGELIVKRVVGLPGENVEVRNGRLYINNRLMQEGYPIGQGTLYVEKGNLLEGDFATLGDNRAVSPALAIHPIVTKADILGKVVLAPGRRVYGKRETESATSNSPPATSLENEPTRNGTLLVTESASPWPAMLRGFSVEKRRST